MNHQEVNAIIQNYHPHNGFFDLSKKPSTLTKNEYAKLIKLQNFLVEQNQNKDYLIKHDPIQWGKLKELSAEIQAIYFEHWGDVYGTAN